MDKLKIHFYLNYSNSERMNLEFQMGRIGFYSFGSINKRHWLLLLLIKKFQNFRAGGAMG